MIHNHVYTLLFLCSSDLIFVDGAENRYFEFNSNMLKTKKYYFRLFLYFLRYIKYEKTKYKLAMVVIFNFQQYQNQILSIRKQIDGTRKSSLNEIIMRNNIFEYCEHLP